MQSAKLGDESIRLYGSTGVRDFGNENEKPKIYEAYPEECQRIAIIFSEMKAAVDSRRNVAFAGAAFYTSIVVGVFAWLVISSMDSLKNTYERNSNLSMGWSLFRCGLCLSITVHAFPNS